jgi:glutamate synthase domain-containing protein 2
MKFASNAKIDFLTIDGAGGGTGMSPWRMMNEWGIPTIYLESMAYNFARRLDEQGAFVPDLAIAGGFSLEDHVFKALALGAPYVKAVCMGRATMIPAMVGKNIGKWLEEGKLPRDIAKYGDDPIHIFAGAFKLKSEYGDEFKDIPLGAIGMYTFCDRIGAGLQQLMAGARKFALKHISRDDIVALTKESAEVTGIPYVMESDREEIDKILSS